MNDSIPIVTFMHASVLPWVDSYVWTLFGVLFGLFSVVPSATAQLLSSLLLASLVWVEILDSVGNFVGWATITIFFLGCRRLLQGMSAVLDKICSYHCPPPWPDRAPYVLLDTKYGTHVHGYSMLQYRVKKKSGHAKPKNGGELHSITSRTMTHQLANSSFSFTKDFSSALFMAIILGLVSVPVCAYDFWLRPWMVRHSWKQREKEAKSDTHPNMADAPCSRQSTSSVHDTGIGTRQQSWFSRCGWQQMIRKGVGTDIGIASLGTRLFIAYHALGYVPSITNHFHDEISCTLTAFLAILLVWWLDRVLGQCVSRFIGTFRVNKLCASDVQIGSILHCNLSLVLAQTLLGICSSLLKSFTFGGKLSLILWQGFHWEYNVENTSILAGLFALVWAKNSIVSRLQSNRSTAFWIIYQLKAMCSATTTITQAYIVTSALGLLFQAAVYNMISSNTRQVFHGINEWVMAHYYILIPLNILSGVIGYLILCELCSLLIGDMIAGLDCYVTFMGQNSKVKVEENEASDKFESKEGEAILQDWGLARKCFEPHSAVLPKYAGAVREEESSTSSDTSSITPNNGNTNGKLQQVQRNSGLVL